jgi:hypothetical protein
MRQDEHFLKVWSGDLSNNENMDWERAYIKYRLNEGDPEQRTKIKHQIAALIHIARETKRTFVFPRHVATRIKRLQIPRVCSRRHEERRFPGTMALYDS